MILEKATNLAVPRWSSDDPEIEIWRDNDGVACAFGQVAGDERWIHIPYVGSFSFSPAWQHAIAVAETGAADEVVEDTFYRIVLPLALQELGQEVLHGSAVRTAAGVVALCAVSETGKSTLAYGLGLRGHELVADDAVVLDLAATPVRVAPVPFTVRLRPLSARHFNRPDRSKQGRVRADGQPVRSSAPLAAVVVLRRLPAEEHAKVEARLLPASEAFLAVLPHAYCFTLRDGSRKRLMMARYLKLCQEVPVFELSYPTGLEYLESILDTIERSIVTPLKR